MWSEGFHDGPHDVVHRDVSPGLWRPRLLPSERSAQDLRPRGSRLHVRGREHSHVPAVWKVRTQWCTCSVEGEITVMYLLCGRWEHSHVPVVWKVRTQWCTCSVEGENTVMYLQCARWEHSHVPAVWKVRTQSCTCSVEGENTVMYLQCGRWEHSHVPAVWKVRTQ